MVSVETLSKVTMGRPMDASTLIGRAMMLAIALSLAWSIQVAPAAAQFRPYRVDHWTTDNGLPQNTVRAMVQTRDGYLNTMSQE